MSYNPATYWRNRSDPAPNEIPDYAKEYITAHTQDAETILDYGVGDGRLLHIYESARIVFGLDITDRYKEASKEQSKGYSFQYIHITEDIREFGGIMFDCAVASKVLLHVEPENIEHIMHSLARVSDKVIVYDTIAPCKEPHNFNHDFSKIVDIQEPLIKGKDLLFWYA